MKKIWLHCWLIWFCLAAGDVYGQSPVTKGDRVNDIAIKKVLNSSAALSSSNGLPGKLTIVDFFGTWCIPCLRALPRLAAIKDQFGPDVSIVLVSNETEAQLRKFIQGRPDFSFPVIVDEDNGWTNRFQPPSLPYTVIVKGGRVIEITEAEKIDKAAVEGWLNATAPRVDDRTSTKTNTVSMTAGNRKSGTAAVQLSQEFLYSARTGNDVTAWLDSLERIPYSQLRQNLVTDDQKKAFWINIYNGVVQSLLKKDPGQYTSRNAFFRAKSITVGGERFSLDDIEHGILRRSKIKWSLGYLGKWFPSKKEKELRVERLDYRIHFALNCGAKSCPPIAFYNDEALDGQLELATKAFLTGEAEFDRSANTVSVPKILSWFRRDFGGKSGIREILRRQGVIPAEADPKIKFKAYDWTLSLNNYTNQSK